MFRSYESYQNATGEWLRALRERPSEEVQDMCVVFFHGRSTDKDELGAFVSLSDALIEAGYDVFRFDFRGQGQSDGQFTSIETNKEDIYTTLDYLNKEKKYSSYIFVIASFSGTSVLPMLTEIDEQIHGVVLRNAVVDLDYAKNPTSPEGKEKWSKREKMVNELGYMKFHRRGMMTKAAYKMMLQAEPWKAFEKISLPIVMVHGTEDESVPYELSKKYADQYDNIKLITIEGGTHGFFKVGLDEAVDACVKGIDKMMLEI